MKSVAVFCGSSHGTDPAFKSSAIELGLVLAEKNIRLVYGGGDVGLMGEVSNAVMDSGGEVTGVIPKFLMEKEVGHKGLTELIVVETMHERKEIMFQKSDAFVILPGGFGTLDEVCEILTWRQLGRHGMPIVFINTNGYFDSLIKFFDEMVEKGFLRAEGRALAEFADDVDSAIQLLSSGA